MKLFASFLPFLVEITLKATLLLGLAWIAGLLMKNHSAALRHAMRSCALIAVLLLPVLSYLMPAWRWQFLPRFLADGTRAARAREAPVELPGDSVRSSRDSESVIADLPTGEPITTMPVASNSQRALNWTQVLLLIWLVGIVLIALRLIVSRSRLALLVRRAAQVDDAAWHDQVRQIAGLLGIRRSVALLQSQETEVPLTSGSRHPKIIFSPDYLEWSWLRREAILHHELAHIRRLDTLAQALCHLAITMYWFHPLVWLTTKAMREEREQACDDYVLAAGTKPSDYAQELLAIALGLRQPDFITALALARRSRLEGRVMALLNPAQRRGSISRSTVLIVALLTLCVVLPLAAIQTAESQTSTTPQTGVAAKPSPSTPSTAEVKPAKPPKSQRAPAVPPRPPAPVAGVTEGIAGGVPGGVPGGVTGGVATVPAIEAVPPTPPVQGVSQKLPQVAPPPPPPPPAFAKPQAAPLPPPPPPALAKPQVAPKAAPLPAPKAVPAPGVAPVAPVAPTVETAPTAPQDEAARIAALATVQAKVAAIHAQQDARQAEVKVLKAKIAAEVRAATLARTSELRAESEEQAAAIAVRVAETAVVRAKVAAIQAITSQIEATVQKAVEKSISQPTSAAPTNPAPTKP